MSFVHMAQYRVPQFSGDQGAVPRAANVSPKYVPGLAAVHRRRLLGCPVRSALGVQVFSSVVS